MNLSKHLKISLTVLLTLIACFVHAQNSWVYFKDKDTTSTTYFDKELNKAYVEQIKNEGVNLLGSSKWLNAICVEGHPQYLEKKFEFVIHVQPLGNYKVNTASIAEDFSYGQGDWQIDMLHLDSFHRKGYTGKGVNLALFDAGFFRVDSFAMFQSLWDSSQIIAAYDFVSNDTLRYNTHTHGMQVLALAGATYEDSIVGAAPGANFVLARTEESGRERHIEEFNWLRGMEWADSVGVDIIHSSLGYSLFDSLEGDYTYADMDGNSTIITLAAELAASRGIFITNSAGNSGNSAWFHITAPCDGRNVLCVGAVDSNEIITGFSSRGPSSDGRIKPEVCAMGHRNTIPNRFGLLSRGSGTSFSGPLIAGLVACLMEAHPERSNAEIFDAIIRSSHQYDTPDNEYGYGIPNVLMADSILTRIASEPRQHTALSVKAFPNPVQNKLQVVCNPNSNYTLLSSSGQLLQSGELKNWINFIDVSTLSSGQYFLNVVHKGRMVGMTIVK